MFFFLFFLCFMFSFMYICILSYDKLYFFVCFLISSRGICENAKFSIRNKYFRLKDLEVIVAGAGVLTVSTPPTSSTNATLLNSNVIADGVVPVSVHAPQSSLSVLATVGVGGLIVLGGVCMYLLGNELEETKNELCEIKGDGADTQVELAETVKKLKSTEAKLETTQAALTSHEANMESVTAVKDNCKDILNPKISTDGNQAGQIEEYQYNLLHANFVKLKQYHDQFSLHYVKKTMDSALMDAYFTETVEGVKTRLFLQEIEVFLTKLGDYYFLNYFDIFRSSAVLMEKMGLGETKGARIFQSSAESISMLSKAVSGGRDLAVTQIKDLGKLPELQEPSQEVLAMLKEKSLELVSTQSICSKSYFYQLFESALKTECPHKLIRVDMMELKQKYNIIGKDGESFIRIVKSKSPVTDQMYQLLSALYEDMLLKGVSVEDEGAKVVLTNLNVIKHLEKVIYALKVKLNAELKEPPLPTINSVLEKSDLINVREDFCFPIIFDIVKILYENCLVIIPVGVGGLFCIGLLLLCLGLFDNAMQSCLRHKNLFEVKKISKKD